MRSGPPVSEARIGDEVPAPGLPARRPRFRCRRFLAHPRRAAPTRIPCRPAARPPTAPTTSAWPCSSSSASPTRPRVPARRSLADPTLALAQINLAIALFYVPDVPDAQRSRRGGGGARCPTRRSPTTCSLSSPRMDNRADDADREPAAACSQADPKDVGAQRQRSARSYLQERRFPEAIDAPSGPRPRPSPTTSARPTTSASPSLAAASARKGRRMMARFQELRESAYKTSFGQNYLEQGRYAEAIASTGAEPDLVDAGDAGGAVRRPGWRPRRGVQREPRSRAGASARRAAATGGRPGCSRSSTSTGTASSTRSTCGAGVLRVLRNERRPASSTRRAASGLGRRRGPGRRGRRLRQRRQARPAGADARRPSRLFHNEGGGRFRTRRHRAASGLSARVARAAAFVDIDHDGDLDVFVAGLAACGHRSGRPLLFPTTSRRRPACFSRTTATALHGHHGPRERAAGARVAVVPTDFDNRRDVDLLVLRPRRAAAPLPEHAATARSRTWRPVSASARARPLQSAGRGRREQGRLHRLLPGAADRPGVLALSDGRAPSALRRRPPATAGDGAAQFLDYDDDGLLDLVAALGRPARAAQPRRDLWRTSARRRWPRTCAARLSTGPPSGSPTSTATATRTLVATAGGAPRACDNRGGNTNRSFARAPGRPRQQPRRRRRQGRDPGGQPAPEARDRRPPSGRGARRRRCSASAARRAPTPCA